MHPSELDFDYNMVHDQTTEFDKVTEFYLHCNSIKKVLEFVFFFFVIKIKILWFDKRGVILNYYFFLIDASWFLNSMLLFFFQSIEENECEKKEDRRLKFSIHFFLFASLLGIVYCERTVISRKHNLQNGILIHQFWYYNLFYQKTKQYNS